MKKLILGIELGSTRVKSVLTDENAEVVAMGSCEWRSELADGLWSYPLESVESCLKASYAELAGDYEKKTGKPLEKVSAIGISAMMHGYLAFDSNDTLLVPFRTWQNTNTEKAADELTDLFNFNVPQRWSVSHYYQAVLDNEAHVPNVAYITTLAGYVHYKLTGKRMLGIGDASGMFPISGVDYDGEMLKKFNALLSAKGINEPFEAKLPKILLAGEKAGSLTKDGALFLDASGKLSHGCPLCPPEGDAQTGMVATNSVAPRTANISAGTSAFLMAVLEKNLSKLYREIDIVVTPSGAPVAMVHANNFTSEITAWTNLFAEVIALSGTSMPRGALFDALYGAAADGDGDCGGLMGYNFLAGEPIVGVPVGIPLIARKSSGNLTLANFMKMHIYSALGALAVGCEILQEENVQIDKVCGHGGFFKSTEVTQGAMSAAVGAPVTVMKNAGEGGAWGIAVLALYALTENETLDAFLDKIFSNSDAVTAEASDSEKRDFALFLEGFKKGLDTEKLAAKAMQ